MSDSWRPAPRRRLGDLGGKAVVIIVVLAILVLAGFGIHRLLTSDSARAADEQVEQVARIIADEHCIRIEGTTLPGTSVPATSYAGTMCDETFSGTLQVDGRQPAGFVMAGVNSYAYGDDFTWAAMGVNTPGGVAEWAVLPDNPAPGPMTLTASKIADAVAEGRTGEASGVGYATYGDFSARADESTRTLHLTKGNEQWRISALAPSASPAVRDAVHAATMSPWRIEEMAGGLNLVGPTPPAPEELPELPPPGE